MRFESAVQTASLGPGVGPYERNNNYTWLRLIVAYLPSGSRISFSAAHRDCSSSGTTYFPFSGYDIGPGGIGVKYIRIGIENVVSKKSTGETLFYHNDHLGGVNVITNTSGLLAQLIEYDPWGKISRSEGAGDSLRRFTGQQLDPESGLYYYGGRYYDPELGRFISPDPFVPQPDDPQSLDRYSYVLGLAHILKIRLPSLPYPSQTGALPTTR